MSFVSSSELIKDVRDHVMNNQSMVLAHAEVLRNAASKAAEDVVKAVAKLKLGSISGPKAPEVPPLKIDNLNLPDIDNTDLGQLGYIERKQFTAKNVNPVKLPNIDDYKINFSQINIPVAPKLPQAAVFPDAPTHQKVHLPAPPSLQRPDLPVLQDLVIPAFVYTPLSPFNDDDPQFVVSSVSAVLQWQEKPYEPVLMDEEVAVLRRMWAGGTGLPPAVEQALWERAAAREDVAAARDVSAAMVEFAARGFALPPGALLARVDEVRADAALQKQSLGREVLLKIADTHIENLRFACTQAIAAENVFIGLWAQMAQRTFDAARFQLDAQVAVLNAQVAAYNAQQNARQISAAVRKMELEEKAHELQVHKMQLEAVLAKGQLNEQRLRVFHQLWQALAIEVEVYKGEMQGAAITADVQKKEVDSYRVQVEAAGEKWRAHKLRFDAYESQIKGETAKAQLVQAGAQAYSHYVAGKLAATDIELKNQQVSLQEQDLLLRAFMANLEADKALLQSQLAEISAKAEVHKVNTQRFVAQASAEGEAAKVQVAAWQAQAQANIAQWEGQMRKVIADMEQMIRAAALQTEAVKMLAQTHATMAAGAMAGVSFSANLGASANHGFSSSINENHSFQHDV